MKVFLLRHGMTSRAETDNDRSLTDDGIKALQDVVGRRVDELSNINTIYTGPLGRIRQTATIAAQVIGFDKEVVDNQSLNKLSRGQEITATLQDYDMSAGDLLLVSHESSLCNLMLWLTLEDILMPNSSLSAIETDGWTRGAGKLLWQESPNSSEIKRYSNFADQF